MSTQEARFLASREARYSALGSSSSGRGVPVPASGRCDDDTRTNDQRVAVALVTTDKLGSPLSVTQDRTKKFAFVKYRAFVGQQHQQQQQQRPGRPHESSEANAVTTSGAGPGAALDSSCSFSSRPLSGPFRDRGEGVVENLVRVHAVVDGRGTVTVTVLRTTKPLGGDQDDDNAQEKPREGSSTAMPMGVSTTPDPAITTPTDTTTATSESRPSSSSSSSLPAAIRNVDRSIVELCGHHYPSVHLSEVRQSTIRIWNGVPHGAVHVTDCHHTSLVLHQSIQQLRIHDSSHLNIHLVPAWGADNDDVWGADNDEKTTSEALPASPRVTVTGGVILENCTAVTLCVARDESPLLDVKDFSFLKRGVPSPNYAVVVVQPQGANTPAVAAADPASHVESGTVPTHATETVPTSPAEAGPVHGVSPGTLTAPRTTTSPSNDDNAGYVNDASTEDEDHDDDEI